MGLWVSRGLFAWPEDTSRMTKCPIYYMVGLILIPIQPLTRATVTFQGGADRAQVRPFSRNPWLGIYFLAWADSQIADLTLPSPHSAPPAFLPGPCWHSTSNASTLGSNAIHYLLSQTYLLWLPPHFILNLSLWEYWLPPCAPVFSVFLLDPLSIFAQLFA